MLAHRFNTLYSDQELINAVQNSNYIEVRRGAWNQLRMTPSSLAGVFPGRQIQRSFTCGGVKLDRRRALVMIGYDIPLQENINWNEAKLNFERFLARHFDVDRSSIEIEAITWDQTTFWYIMTTTSVLLQALNDRREEAHHNPPNWLLIPLAAIAVVVAVPLLVVFAIIKP